MTPNNGHRGVIRTIILSDDTPEGKKISHQASATEF